MNVFKNDSPKQFSLWSSSITHIVSFYSIVLVSTQRHCTENVCENGQVKYRLCYMQNCKVSLEGAEVRLYSSITQFPDPCCVVVPLAKKPVKESPRACVQPSMLIVNWWGWQDERTAEHVVSQTQAVDRPLVIITAAAHILTTQLFKTLLWSEGCRGLKTQERSHLRKITISPTLKLLLHIFLSMTILFNFLKLKYKFPY